MHRFSAILILLILAGFCVAPSLAIEISLAENATIHAFENAGFLVNVGKMETFDVISMYNAGLTPSCYANNPSAPYMTAKIPKAPGQTSNNTMSDAPLIPENRGLWVDYKFRPDEAVVFIGKTPPACDYFSYCGYLVMRYFPDSDGDRRVFASLGDSTNNLMLAQESGHPENVFEQPIIMILTADKNADRRVRDTLVRAGYPVEVMHTKIIPNSLVRMGLDDEADTFSFLHRVAFFHDAEAGSAYMNSTPGIVYRLTLAVETKPDYYPVPRLIIRGTGDTRELDLYDDLEELRGAILEKYGRDRAEELVTQVWLYEGYDAIQRGIDVLGEIRDTVYLQTSNTTLGNDPDEFIIVFGVNHAATGKATYSNFGLYGTTAMNGIGGVSNHNYTGTAEAFLPDNPNAKYLYVAKIARHAYGDPATVVIPSGVGAYGIEPDEPCFVGYRAYAQPATMIGAEWSELAYDRAIKFNPRPGFSLDDGYRPGMAAGILAPGRAG
ncbi:MAG: hypothetical protein M0Q92_05135 [Methanoregula sp.]|jgi:hypothetical protein|nr:hypothetical protein [Methanoregula sp.]